MTYKQFLKALRKTPREWSLDVPKNNGVEPVRILRMHHLNSGMVYCPITAVCKFHRGKELYVYSTGQAANELKLSLRLQFSIAGASDGDTTLRSKTLRDLLKATGLA